MKHIRIIAVAGLLLMCLHATSHAQEWFGLATWNISFPVEDTKKFVNDTSFRGFGLEFRKEFRPSTTFGIMGSWEVFHQRTSSTINLESGAITGSQDRYINSFPIMAGLHRYFGAEGGTRPYIGINGGGFILIQTLRVGLAQIEDDTWEWGIMPEAGFIMPLDRGSGFIANVRYNWALTGQDLAGNDAQLTYWGVRVGFVWERY
ncbi:MAG TPA: hypothetical protein VFH88_13075 [Candidatus Krumholzibacteria bacterium]|nr:hypothetical protein [Candidatus Krumholzibacteria bacterium]